MNSTLSWIAENKSLTALANVGGIIGLTILLITAARRLWRWLSLRTSSHYYKSFSRNMADAKAGSSDPSYLTATFAHHFIMLGIFLWILDALDNATKMISAIKDTSSALGFLLFVGLFSKWIVSFLIGDRAADILIIARHVRRAREES